MISDILTTFTGYLKHLQVRKHSSINECAVQSLYGFVEINIDTKHLLQNYQKELSLQEYKILFDGYNSIQYLYSLIQKIIIRRDYQIETNLEKPIWQEKVLRKKKIDLVLLIAQINNIHFFFFEKMKFQMKNRILHLFRSQYLKIVKIQSSSYVVEKFHQNQK
ncbi:unnamed protein product [Paramecium sonneborni]|uniref:Uncharacterized protein n=1 Tax=Paramecium sonneborni TaxID=65129 RepID=A0A8S1KG27_9CILI|nr:unnamed protein product [Paramecium sonneborni]